MLNAVMLTHNRPLLTKQALETFFSNSKLDWTLTVVDDDSNYQTESVLRNFNIKENMKVLKVSNALHNTALLRNMGVWFSDHYWGRGDFLYLSDNDACFTYGWDEALLSAWKMWQDKFKLVGPYRHPFHQPIAKYRFDGCDLVATDAVQGIGHMMRWETWDKYGPLSEHKGQGNGTNQSEDFAFCQAIVKDGFLVGSIQPEVVHNCGITGSNGKPSPGSNLIERLKGVYYE